MTFVADRQYHHRSTDSWSHGRAYELSWSASREVAPQVAGYVAVGLQEAQDRESTCVANDMAVRASRGDVQTAISTRF